MQLNGTGVYVNQSQTGTMITQMQTKTGRQPTSCVENEKPPIPSDWSDEENGKTYENSRMP